MSGVAAWLAAFWIAVWPNLAASCIWAPPAFVASHMAHRRHLRRELARHHAQHGAANVTWTAAPGTATTTGHGQPSGFADGSP